MSKISRADALEEISKWNTNDVVLFLRKNALEEECCKAVEKRQVDGDEFLHLTEGKLALWKSDLSRPLIWSFRKFIEDVLKSPEKYIEMKENDASEEREDELSETGSWGSDFEDCEERCDENIEFQVHNKTNGETFQKEDNAKTKKLNGVVEWTVINGVENNGNNTYANCDNGETNLNTYANCETDTQTKRELPIKNVSRLHSPSDSNKSLAEQLKEQLELRSSRNPISRVKPEIINAKATSNEENGSKKLPQQSFLHNKAAKQRNSSTPPKRMSVPPPAEPKKNLKDTSSIKEAVKKPSPPITIRNLDLLANLPSRTTQSSEDEYEAFDEQIIEQHRANSIGRVDSKQSLSSSTHKSSIESLIYPPRSISSQQEEIEEYEIYESITETPGDNGEYLKPKTVREEPPPPLPAKPMTGPTTTSPQIPSRTPQDKRILSNGGLLERLADEISDMIVQIKRSLSRCCYSRPPELPERSPDKKSATLPHSPSNNSLSSERATRPLPPPPEKQQSYVDKPWFHNVTREQAAALIKEQGAYGNIQDGYFLLRPSTTNPNNPLALVLWYKDRVYNVPVRKRPDNRYALGSPKLNELSFLSVEEIVSFYSREEKLVLHTGGVQTGSTKLTDTPPK